MPPRSPCSEPFVFNRTEYPYAILSQAPVSPLSLNRELWPKLGEIIERALEKDRKLRYQTASDLRADLQRLKRDTESGRAAVRERAVVRLGRWYRWALGAFGALAILVATLVALNVGGWRERLLGGRAGRPRIESLAVFPLANLSGDPAQEYFSDGMTDALITDLAQIGSLKVISRTSVMHYKKTDKTLPEIARELNVDGIVEGTCSAPAIVCWSPHSLCTGPRTSTSGLTVTSATCRTSSRSNET